MTMSPLGSRVVDQERAESQRGPHRLRWGVKLVNGIQRTSSNGPLVMHSGVGSSAVDEEDYSHQVQSLFGQCSA
jgi:hypothetical protein